MTSPPKTSPPIASTPMSSTAMASTAVSASKLAIIAGGGDLPRRVAETAHQSGRPYTVLALKGFADWNVEAHPHHWLALGELGRALEIMKSEGVADLVMCGRVTRPNFSNLRVDWTGMKLLPRLVLAGTKGDDALLSFLVREMETHGLRVVGPDAVLGELLALEGVWTVQKPSADDQTDIDRGIDVVRTLGHLDIGQAAIVADGLVLAVEAAEGTDKMLARVADLPAELRNGHPRKGVLVKMPKPSQERRIDLPTIGVETVRRAVAARLNGIAVEANGTLVMDRKAICELADREGLFIIGFAKPTS